ncbi:MAG: hypothetical protein GY866_05705 [Proteobacteria bacterium]|nr:hypothetical protein [Pseudomonadota bacterium]
MRMWSKGLGKIELEVDFSHYKVVTEEENTVIKGITEHPIKWNFTITLEKEDIPGLLNVLFKPGTLLFLIANIKTVFRFVFEKLFRRHRYYEFDRKNLENELPLDTFTERTTK